MKTAKKMLGAYSRYVSNHPYLMLFLVLIVSSAAYYESKKIELTDMDDKKMLPQGLDVMEAFTLVEDEFGSGGSGLVVVELDQDRNTIDDIREPEVIAYLNLLTDMASHTEDVVDATSAATVFKEMNEGHLPKTRQQVIDLSSTNPGISRYLSRDHTMALVRLKLADGASDLALTEEFKKILENTPRPPGVTVDLAGDAFTGPVINEKLGPDMSRTSMFSLIGIVVVLVLLFKSFKHGFIPLATIGFGVIWAFGFIGLTGMNMSSTTSGVVSMIMGIGIDFGIQTVSRFRQELKKSKAEKAMETTMNNVFIPMATTSLAALIGFKAMAMGQLTFMAEMGVMMSYGIAACFLAAITIVPALLVIGERFTVGGKR